MTSSLPRNLILTGVPRGGTTLACKLLGQAEDAVSLSEPMPVHELPLAPAAAVDTIQAYFDSARARLLASGTAISQQIDGESPDNYFSNTPGKLGLRTRQARTGEIRVNKPLSPAFTLTIKHNAAFTALLPWLAPVFNCFAIVRNPLAVLASWNSVDIPIALGRLPMAERLNPALGAWLDTEPDVLERQLFLLDWMFAQYAQTLPPERIIQYEHISSSDGAALAAATGLALPPEPLQDRNASALYDPAASQRHAERLCQRGGAWRMFYSDEAIMHALDALLQ